MLVKHKACLAFAALAIPLFLYFITIPLVTEATARRISESECAKAQQDATALEWLLENPAPGKTPCNLYEKPPIPISFPQHKKGKSNRILVEARLYYSPLWSETFSLSPARSVERMEINGVTVPPPYADSMDLSPYLSVGSNRVALYIHRSGPYVINLESHRSLLMHVMIISFLGLGLFFSLSLFLSPSPARGRGGFLRLAKQVLGNRVRALYAARALTPALSRTRERGKSSALIPTDYCLVAAIPVACILALSIAYNPAANDLRNTSLKLLPPAFRLLPVLTAFLLWFRKFREDYTGSLTVRPIAWAITIAATEIACDLLWNDWKDWQSPVMLAAVVASLLVWIDIRQAVRFIAKEPRFTLVAAVASSAVLLYGWLYKDGGVQLCLLSAKAVYGLLYLTGMDIVMQENMDNTIISSGYYAIKVYWGCSGLEGILLFFFLLSAMLLLDWQWFKHRRLLPIYLFGFVYMLSFNILRIASLFTLGYWAYNPNAPEWAHQLQGAPVYLFHSYVGWVYYFIAFALFTLSLYQQIARENGK